MKIKEKFYRVRRFVTEDLWELDFPPLSWPKKILFGFLKVCFIVFRGFSRDRCALHAAALTYITLMSMVPLVALMFSMAKGFGAGSKLREVLATHISQMPENVQDYIQQMLVYVENTHFGVIGGVGLVVLLYTVVMALGKIESTFNSIWGVKAERSLIRKFTDYISVILVVPILLLAATSINATLSSHQFLIWLKENTTFLGPIYEQTGTLTGMAFIWLAFSFIYIFMPNTRVHWAAALAGGIVAGTLFQLLQWAYINVQMMVSNYNAIYGTFASVPIFMAWLFVCWEIVLFGCEVSFAVQNLKTYEHEGHALKANQATRELLALALMKDAGKHFENANGGWSPSNFSDQHHISIRLVRDVVHQLSQAKILYSIDAAETHFVPARPLEAIHIKDITLAMRGQPEKKVAKKFSQNSTSDETTLKKLIEKKVEGGAK